jgi:YidC/Oxa1 family membrane protein insertase
MLEDKVWRKLPTSGGGGCGLGCNNTSAGPITDAPDKNEAGVAQRQPLHWFGIDQQYFLAAIYPLREPMQGRCVLEATDTERTVTAYFPLDLPAGSTWSHSFGIYIGPKDPELLDAVPSAALAVPTQGAPPSDYKAGLDKSIDYSWWAVICKVMVPILHFFYRLFGNWGVAIILLTVMVKVVLLPLTYKQTVQAEQMKKLAPQIAAIKKKYPDDKERQNVETMKMYQENKVNPLGGCLPLLVQLPIWGALFTTLRTSFDIYGQPFISPLWADLTYRDPTYILPLAVGITMVITQRMQPQMMDAAQARMMTWFMPIFFTWMMVNYPSGLSLYIFTNNILSVVQQRLLRRWLERTGQLAPKTPVKKGDDDKKSKKNRKAEAT